MSAAAVLPRDLCPSESRPESTGLGARTTDQKVGSSILSERTKNMQAKAAGLEPFADGRLDHAGTSLLTYGLTSAR